MLHAASPSPPIRGLHIAAPKPDELTVALKFIQEALPKEGVNVLVLEFDYRYQFSKRPEVAEPDALSRDDVKQLVAACRKAGVRLIPQINLLGHQSWAEEHGSAAARASGIRRDAGQVSGERRHLLPQLLPAASRGARRGLRPDRRAGRRLRSRRVSRGHGRSLPDRRGRLSRAARAKTRRNCSRPRRSSCATIWPRRIARCGCGATACWTARPRASASGKPA